MSQDQWGAVDDYFVSLLVPSDDARDAALQSIVDAKMPLMNVAPNQGMLLHLLARSHGVRSILEIGTMVGYSTIWLARALPADGRLVTLEINPDYAAIARANIERAGLANRVEIQVGPAIEALPKLSGPFDLVFIDADKVNNPAYLEWALRLTKPGSLIIIDNVVRSGAVTDLNSTDASVQGTQKALAMLAENPRIVSTALQTVGSKGYDGFAIALVTE
ncbi:MAG: O-methyltransferase [Burkholderiales bacterium]|nr:O-methyltransferase [Anaerolineae bacterium]